MSNNTFNPIIAEKYGVYEAIIIETFVFWTKTNAAKGSNFHEERYWCFGTPEYFRKFFTYLTQSQIKYSLKKLFSAGVLLKGNFNKKGYDKTNWYSLSDSILLELNLDKTCSKAAPVLIEQIYPMDRTNLSNGSDKFVQPIPSTKPSTKQDNKINKNDCSIFDSASKGEEYPETYYATSKDVESEKLINEILQTNTYAIPEELIRAWIEYRKAKNTPVTISAWFLMCKELYKYAESKLDPIEAFELMVSNGWSSLNIKKSLEYNQKAKYKPKAKTQTPVYDHNDTSWINDISKDMF